MSYKIIRLEKRKSRRDEDEIFVELKITDDLGTYPYGRWFDVEEIEAVKAAMKPADYEACSRLSEFKFAYPELTVIHEILLEHLPIARQLKEETVFEQNYEKAKKLAEIEAINPGVKRADLDALKNEILTAINKGKT